MSTVFRISDLSDPRLADFTQLTDVALRKVLEPEGGLYLAESLKVIQRSLAAGHVPRAVLIQEQWLSDIEPLVANDDCPIFVAPAELIAELTGYDMHRGAMASMNRPRLPELSDLLSGAKRVVVLEDIVDHTNVGAIFRAVAGLGADAVLISPRCADPLYRRSVRVSMGTVLQVPWTRLPEWAQAREILHKYGFHISALALSDQAIPLKEFATHPPEKIALVFGSEGDGLSREALGVCDSVVTIPMKHGVDSLNVASASAVVLYALTE
ncbi:TrmH family RNA methyltransferase [Aurantimicrobium minutum]|uniref:TrmH family RNA methyltransferase n=1 Tax=Aurantimicrobium minutum TaxID=708131 RepID=UPI0024767705|nr:RNA methyltransferase [Aurantimicrobium minutum]MDH6239444.1 tRNA G18 (ribose-2'-O)-methylase SpoU [Aurantimicrobium minutum]